MPGRPVDAPAIVEVGNLRLLGLVLKQSVGLKSCRLFVLLSAQGDPESSQYAIHPFWVFYSLSTLNLEP